MGDQDNGAGLLCHAGVGEADVGGEGSGVVDLLGLEEAVGGVELVRVGDLVGQSAVGVSEDLVGQADQTTAAAGKLVAPNT